MEQLGRTLILIGVGITALGALIWFFGKVDFRGLPGDIKFESYNFKVYLPFGTSIAISLALSLGFWLWRTFQGR